MSLDQHDFQPSTQNDLNYSNNLHLIHGGQISSSPIRFDEFTLPQKPYVDFILCSESSDENKDPTLYVPFDRNYVSTPSDMTADVSEYQSDYPVQNSALSPGLGLENIGSFFMPGSGILSEADSLTPTYIPQRKTDHIAASSILETDISDNREITDLSCIEAADSFESQAAAMKSPVLGDDVRAAVLTLVKHQLKSNESFSQNIRAVQHPLELGSTPGRRAKEQDISVQNVDHGEDYLKQRQPLEVVPSDQGIEVKHGSSTAYHQLYGPALFDTVDALEAEPKMI